MKTKIIFFDTYNNLIINNLINVEDGGYKKYYKKFNKDIMEIIFYADLNQISRIISAEDKNRCIFVVKEINDNNIDIIKTVNHSNITLVCGMAGLNNLNYKGNCESLNNIIYFPQLADESEAIDLDLFTLVVNNKNLNHKPQYILFGKELEKTACGKIPIFILKRFDKIQKLKYFHLELYNKYEMNIEDISYIEDCISEYITDEANLTINQLKNKSSENKTYFFLYAQ